MQPEVSQPENGGDSSGDAVIQGPEAMEEPTQGEPADPNGPAIDGETAPEEPEATEEPEDAPSAGRPFGDGMLAFDSEEEALAYLWSLEDDEYGIMPIGEVTDQKVSADYFRFSTYGANEAGTPTTYSNFAALKVAYPTVTPDWDVTGGPDGGDLLDADGKAVKATLGTYPQIEGYEISSIRVNGTIIYHLGMYKVGDNSYVHFTSITAQGRLTTVVVTKAASEYGTKPFEVRYVPEEYEITYEVYEGTRNVTEARKDQVFGDKPSETTVDQWASVDVTIPAGYIGHVYIGNSSEIQNNGTYEKYPNESSYGNYPLGAEPKYTYNAGNNSIEFDTSGAPDSYTLTGTYLVGRAGAGVSANQTVRVVLTKKESITFHAEAWRDYEIGGTPTSNKVNTPSADGSVTNDGWTVEKDLEGNSVDFTWTFTVVTYRDGSPQRNEINDAELRTLEINGASIKVPFVSATATSDAERTQLPSGAWVEISATWDSGTSHPSYTIKIEGATRDIWITGGSMNTGLDNTYKELIVSGLYGVDVELLTSAGSTDTVGTWSKVAAGDTFCTGYSWGNYEQQDAYGDAGFLYHKTGTSGDYSGNVRFQLQEGFTFARETGGAGSDGTTEYPTVKLVAKTGETRNTSAGDGDNLTVSGPDSAGWYYVTLVSPYGTTADSATLAGTTDAYLLEVRAYPEQYVVAYQDGVTDDTGNALNPGITGTVSNMPAYTRYGNRYVDNNSDQYYALAAGDGSYSGGDASDSISVSESTPTIDRGGEREVTFQGWVLTDASGSPYRWSESDSRPGITIADEVTTDTGAASGEYPIIHPSDLLELRNIMDASGEGFGATGTEYALYLTALWSTPADRYTYYVTFNYTDEKGETHERVAATVTRKEGAEPREHVAVPFEDGSDGYYVVKRETYFNLEGLEEELGSEGLSVVFDPGNVQSITGGGNDWRWYKYDTAKNGSGDGDAHDPYKWTGVDNNGEVAVWYISTESQLTIGKEVEDLFPSDEDPADTAANDATFDFTVEFTLPEEDNETTGHEPEYFGTGEPYTVKYTVSGGEEQDMDLTQGSDGKFTGELSLKKGQTATFTLLAGTKYTVTEQKGYTNGGQRKGHAFQRDIFCVLH